MIWLTWRQFRIQALIGGAVTVVVAAVFLATRGSLLQVARDMGYQGCTADCDQLANQFLQRVDGTQYSALQKYGSILLMVMPALVGLFWGAPLVARELEAGTHRLVWNQTVSRGRWLAVKLGGIGLATVVVAGLLTWAITAWASPIDRAGDWMSPDTFTVRGVVPIGYAAFAFVAGVTIGMLMRRTVPAMAVTLVVVVGAVFLSMFVLRPHLVAQTTYQGALTADRIHGIGLSINDPQRRVRIETQAPVKSAWVLSNDVVTSSGASWHGPYDPTRCGPGVPGGPEGCEQWIASQNLQQKVIYLGPDKFWPLQWRELGAFLVVSALLVAFCFWWIRRRVA
ncbi:ABC transporter permease [Actinoplanes sp. KI2]|uniref:ABC transporter permease n=1 Tax=Actinoplanes sp. KI2 TaxID=2983315 RepID=UPI0021D5C26E|nr:ABC transporter permease [Actinoplanes sp. KI2]MCU7730205.1 ABC transporter permease [Actinoplanes sp. KI2]